jgi:hypothetical protein
MLLYLLDCRIQRKCFFCNDIKGSGNRWLTINDLHNIYNNLSSYDINKVNNNNLNEFTLNKNRIINIDISTINCLYECNEFNFNENIIKEKIENSIHLIKHNTNINEARKKEINKVELRKLFEERKKRTIGGVCICWSGCESSLNCYQFLQELNNKVIDKYDNNNNNTSNINKTLSISDFPFDLGYMKYNSNFYNQFLNTKIELLKLNFPNIFTHINLEIFPSSKKHFRSRCRFGIQHSNSYNSRLNKEINEINFAVWDNNGYPSAIITGLFPISSMLISLILHPLKLELEIYGNTVVTNLLQSCHILSTLKGHLVVRLCYGSGETQVDNEEWLTIMEKIKYSILHNYNINGIVALNFIYRGINIIIYISNIYILIILVICTGKNKKIVLGKDVVDEEFILNDGRVLRYLYYLYSNTCIL